MTIVLAIALFLGVAALACGIACNASDAVAVLVLVGGAAVIAFLTFLAIRGIRRSGVGK